ncbi:ATP-dependent endonuclease [Vibrio gazogenes]|uniref:Putative ATP-dependent endonuclease of the OLD family n=2 Tax=Vibrio gazogenes TaxID=687 RepID=A0A1M5G1R3_VIBGA|nr:AAA family ATPase [Vibrio gazogenes]USP14728.1 AAA family ATPase [Vibrio gazogenes]SHF97391.1 putative ATP-dependent endonuclease of the OLD family [Vibrio gazogenes DSM 21264] [Vibrio gazogenes DSM 21264 = NBRC 103151]
MYLSSIKAENFRGFESTHVTLNKGLNLLVGENDAGKTSLIDAVRLVLDTNSAEWVRIKYSDFRTGSTKLKISLKFCGLSALDGGAFAEYLTFEQDESGDVQTVLHITLTASINEILTNNSQGIRTEIRAGSDDEGPLLDRDTRLYLSTTYLKPLRDAQNELSAGRMSRLSQLLGSKSSIGGNEQDIERLITLIIQANQSIKADTSISTAQGSIERLLKQITFKDSPFAPVIDMLGSKNVADMSTAEKNSAFKAIVERLTLGLNDTGLSHGLGYSNLLFMAAELMLLAQAGEGFPLLLIEEPEAHLHPQLQMKFIQYLVEEQAGLQCILSTHSPNLASKVSLENIILMNKGQSFPLRRGATLLDGDDYPFLEKFLDVSKANMFFAKSVLLVEGDGENILLPTIAKLLGRPLEDYGVSIVNVGNLAYKRYAKIYRKKEVDDQPFPMKVACVTDLDIWPDKAEKKPGSDIGFKVRILPDPEAKKKGNLSRWVSYYDDKQDELAARKANKCEQDGENVKTFVSEEWTFEYCLAKSGLAKELYHSVKGSEVGFEDLSDDPEEKAIQIYGMIEKMSSGKTTATYKLTEILNDAYQRDSIGLKNKLPLYIVSAIEYVTEPIIEEQAAQEPKVEGAE